MIIVVVKICFVLVLLSMPFAIVAADRAIRTQRTAPWAIEQEDWVPLIALAVLCNVAVLPFYFYKTRRSVLASFGGLVLFGLYLLFAYIVAAVVFATGTAIEKRTHHDDFSAPPGSADAASNPSGAGSSLPR
jgi:hypothetical protein